MPRRMKAAAVSVLWLATSCTGFVSSSVSAPTPQSNPPVGNPSPVVYDRNPTAIPPGTECPAPWVTEPLPSAGNAQNEISSLVAITNDDVWAIGTWTTFPKGQRHTLQRYTELGGIGRPMLPTSLLAVHWDGAAWGLAQAPALPHHRGWIHAAEGSGANDIWAVGGTLYPGTHGEKGLAFHWDGASWHRVTIPAVNGEHDLFDVEALGPDDAWSVGRRGISPYRTLAMRWDGVAWTTVPSPNTKGDNELNAVAASSPDDVWAVGSAHADGAFERTTPLIEHWNGTRWSIVPIPDTLGTSTLWDVSALAPDDVWAVGEEDVDGLDHAALLWHWDGVQWAEETLPQGPTLFGLDRVSPGSDGVVWVRGQDQSFASVFFRFDGNRWQLAGSQRFIDVYALGVIAATQDDRLLVAGEVPVDTLETAPIICTLG